MVQGPRLFSNALSFFLLLPQPTFSIRELVPACMIAVASLLAYALCVRLRSRWSVHLLSNVTAAFLVASVSSLVLAGFTRDDVTATSQAIVIATYGDDHSGEANGRRGGNSGARGARRMPPSKRDENDATQ